MAPADPVFSKGSLTGSQMATSSLYPQVAKREVTVLFFFFKYSTVPIHQGASPMTQPPLKGPTSQHHHTAD